MKRPLINTPKSEADVEDYVLQRHHFCSNFRCDDATSVAFTSGISKVKDAFVLLCSALLLALVPKDDVYNALIKAATGLTKYLDVSHLSVQRRGISATFFSKLRSSTCCSTEKVCGATSLTSRLHGLA